MGDHVTELNFDSKLQFVKVCWSLRMRLQFLSQDIAVVGFSDCFFIREH